MDSYRNKVPFLTPPLKVDLGAGQYPKEGYIRADFDPDGSDICWDFTQGIPLPNDSVNDLYTSHFLEHFTETDAHYIMMEIFRVCMNGAKLEIRVPHANTPQGKLPCHYRLIDEDRLTGIALWFSDGVGFKLEKMWRDGIHLSAIYTILK